MRPSPRSAGFTWLEVMTTVAIVSLVLIMLYSCWSAVLNASESSQRAAQNSHRERITLQALDEVFAEARERGEPPATTARRRVQRILDEGRAKRDR